MANIGTTTAFYKVETSLSRANNEVSKSMERLATGRQNANAGDRSSYVAMADTCLLYTSPSPRDLSTSRMPSSA